MHCTAELLAQLKDIGVASGMDLLVHSSLKRLGPVEGGADGIIDTLLAAIAPDGTLMMSTVSGNVNAAQTVFHVAHTPSTVGALTNVFRQRPGTIRSLHPVHSIAAIGPKAKFFTEGHIEARTPWSAESPYRKLMSSEGFILFLGTDFSANTCIHAIEIEAQVPGLHTETSTRLQVMDYDGVLYEIEHHWHAPKLCCYTDLEHLVERAGGLTYGRIGNTICRLVDATILHATLLPLFRKSPELGVLRKSNSRFIWE